MATKTLLFLVFLAISQIAFAEEQSFLKRTLNSYQQNAADAVSSVINEKLNKEDSFINLGINTIKKIAQFGNGQGINAGIGYDSQGLGRLPISNLGEESLNSVDKSLQTGFDVAKQSGQNAFNSASSMANFGSGIFNGLADSNSNIDKGIINLVTPKIEAIMGESQSQEGSEEMGQSQSGGQNQGIEQTQNLGLDQEVGQSQNKEQGQQDRAEPNNWGGFLENFQTLNRGEENELGKSTNKLIEAKDKMVGKMINELQQSINGIEKHKTENINSVTSSIEELYQLISYYITNISSHTNVYMKNSLTEYYKRVNMGLFLMKQKSTDILNNGQEMGNKIVNHVKDQMYMMPDRLSTMLEGVKHKLEDCLNGNMDVNKFCEFLELNLTKFNKDKSDEFKNLADEVNVRLRNEIEERKQHIINYFIGEVSKLNSSAEKGAKLLPDLIEEVRSKIKDLPDNKNGVFTNILAKVRSKIGKMNKVKRDLVESAVDNLKEAIENWTNSKDFGKTIDDAKSKVKGIFIDNNEVVKNSINNVKHKVENKIEECKHAINQECDHLKDAMQPSNDMVKSLVLRIREKISKLKQVKSDAQQEILDDLRGQLKHHLNAKKDSFKKMADKVKVSLIKYFDEGKHILNSLSSGKEKTMDFMLEAEFKINEIGDTLKNKCSTFANHKNQFITNERNKMSTSLDDLIKKKNDLIIKIREGTVDADGITQNDVNSIKPQIDKVKNSLGSFKKKNDAIIDSLQNLIDKLSQLKNKKETLPDKVFDSVKNKIDDWADSMNKEVQKKLTDGKTDDMIDELNDKLKVWKEELLKQLVDQLKTPDNKKENDLGDIGAQLQSVKDKCTSNGKETLDEVIDTVDNLNGPLSSAIKNKQEAPSEIGGPAKKKMERYAKNFFRQLGINVCPCPKYFK